MVFLSLGALCHVQLAQIGTILPGTFSPTCEEDGSYAKKQCHGSTGYCWCVNQYTGDEIQGTMTSPTQTPVDCEGKIISAAMEATTLSIVYHGNSRLQKPEL